MPNENNQQSDKKNTKYKIAETVTADGPKRPKPKDSDSSSD